MQKRGIKTDGGMQEKANQMDKPKECSFKDRIVGKRGSIAEDRGEGGL